jgi:hypothetical protein
VVCDLEKEEVESMEEKVVNQWREEGEEEVGEGGADWGGGAGMWWGEESGGGRGGDWNTRRSRCL